MGKFTFQGFQKWFCISPNSKIDRVIPFWKSAFFPYKMSFSEILYGKNALFENAITLSIVELGET